MSCVVLALLTISAAACKGPTFKAPQQSPDPLLDKVSQPSLNAPQKQAPTPVPAPESPGSDPIRLLGDRSGMLIIMNGRLVSGSLTAAGRLTHKSSVMELAAGNQPAVRIVYRLPKPLPAPPELSASGRLEFSDRSSPAGPNRKLVVSTDGIPLVGELWLTSPNAITVDFAPGVRLTQRSGSPDQPQTVPVHVGPGPGEQPLPVGVATVVKTAAGLVQILVEATYRVAPDPAGQDPGGYILHAWIVRSGG